MGRVGKKVFQVEEITCVKTLRRGGGCHILGTKRRPTYVKRVVYEMRVKLAGSRSLGTMIHGYVT